MSDVYTLLFLFFQVYMFSKTKVENILGLGLNALNLSLYLMTMAASVMKAVMEYRDVSHIMTCTYGL